jgi:hypothetical protein
MDYRIVTLDLDDYDQKPKIQEVIKNGLEGYIYLHQLDMGQPDWFVVFICTKTRISEDEAYKIASCDELENLWKS